jgi:TetR/AcrR family transcriptional regulator, repressor for neighboring sulfatase
VINAATKLFALRSADSVSIRDIAKAAQVNHALVHRYFRSKDVLLQTILERSAREIAKSFTNMVDTEKDMGIFLENSFAQIGYFRAVGRMLIDGRAPLTLQHEFPTVKRLIKLLRAKQAGRLSKRGTQARADFQMRVRAIAITVLTMGWVLFEPAALIAAELEHYDVANTRKEISAILRLLATNRTRS